MKFFFSYTLRSHRPVYQKMFKEKSDSKLHRHLQETTFQTCNNATGNKALEWVLILLFHYKQDRKQDKMGIFSNRTDAVIMYTSTPHSSAAIFTKYSLSILKSLHPSSLDRSEAPLLL